MLRIDFVFSNWIFIWFILFILQIIQYNPSFIIILGYISVIFETIYIWKHNTTEYNIQKFVVINIFLKNIPLFILWYTKNIFISLADLYFTIFLFIIYNIYLYINNTDMMTIYYKLIASYINDEKDVSKKTLWSNLYDYVYSKVHV